MRLQLLHLAGQLWAAKDTQPVGVVGGTDAPLPEWIKVIPFGTWLGHPMGAFSIGTEDAQEIVANFVSLGRDLVIDYEHQTLYADYSGTAAPAAGWMDRLEVREDGIWAHVRMWTDRAAAFLRAKEYRYLSPVLFFDTTDPRSGRRVGTALHSVALTNSPFLSELPPIVNRGGASASSGGSMLSWLLLALGLPATTSETDAKASVEDLANGKRAACRALGLPEAAKAAEIEAAAPAVAAERRMGAAACSALKVDAKALPADAEVRLSRELAHSGYVPLAEHARALRAAGEHVDALTDAQILEQAIANGLVTPAMKTWAKDYIGKDRAGFQAWASASRPTVPVQPSPPPPRTTTAEVALTDAQVAVCKQLNLTPSQWREAYPHE